MIQKEMTDEIMPPIIKLIEKVRAETADWKGKDDFMKENGLTWNDEWSAGFEAGFKFCKDLPPDIVVKFFPFEKGSSFCNGFAEGTTSGKHEFNVNWKFIEVDGNTNYVKKL